MTRVARLFSLSLLAALAAARARADEYPRYEDVARLPSSYASSASIRFTMRYLGVGEVDDCFAAVGRNGATHVQVVVPRVQGAKEALPVFVSRSKSATIERLREADLGVTYYFRGRIRWFESEVYQPLPPGAPRSATVKVAQSENLGEFYVQGTTQRPPAGVVRHYVFDVEDFRDLKDHEKPADASQDRPQPQAGYQPAAPRDLGARGNELAGRPVRIPFTYHGALGRAVAQGGSSAALEAFRSPEATCVTASDLEETDRDPTQGLMAFEFGRLTAVFAEGWDVAATLRELEKGDAVELEGVLERAPDGGILFVIEGIERAADGGRRGR